MKAGPTGNSVPPARASTKAPVKPVAPKTVAKRSEKATATAGKVQRTVPAEGLCSNRTQFAYLYCMQEQCARASQRNNAQCAALRRSGELR